MMETSDSASNVIGIIRLLRRTGGELVVTVEGNSMLPLFSGPTRLRVACSDMPDFVPGTLVLFKGAGSNLVVHRLLAISRNRKYLIARGDNNFAIDRPVRPEAVLGIVRGFADSDRPLGLSAHPGRLSGLLVRTAAVHYSLGFVIAAVSILLQGAWRRVPRLSLIHQR